MDDPLFKAMTIAFAASLAAATLGVLWYLLRPTPPSRTWHVFFAVSWGGNSQAQVHYLCGSEVGEHSWPAALSTELQLLVWVRTSVAGFPTAAAAIAAAESVQTTHQADINQVYSTYHEPTDAMLSARLVDPGIG